MQLVDESTDTFGVVKFGSGEVYILICSMPTTNVLATTIPFHYHGLW